MRNRLMGFLAALAVALAWAFGVAWLAWLAFYAAPEARGAPLPFRWREPGALDPAGVKIGDKAWVAYARGQVRKAVAVEVHPLLPGGTTKGWAWDEDDGHALLWVRMEDFKAYKREEDAAREALRMMRRWQDDREEDVPVRRTGP
jgi:hypothetical protein